MGDPGFLDAVVGDYRLSPDSSLVDQGFTVDPAVSPERSLDGLPRVNGPAIDIGAFETARNVFADGFEL